MADPIRAFLYQFVRRERFLAKYRYYAAILERLDPIEDEHVPVMAVSQHGRRCYLHINVHYFLNPVERMQYVPGVLLHEVHHVVMGHLSNPRLREVEHPGLMELAMEISANEFISEPLPGEPPTVQRFARFGIRAGQSTRERYDILVRAQSEGRVLPQAVCWVDRHLPRGVGIGQGVGPDAGTDERIRRLIRTAVQETEAILTPEEKRRSKLAGHSPGWFLEQLPGSDEPPQRYLDWRTALRMFIAQVRQPVPSYTRPNRRFPNRVGEIPGRSYRARQTPAKRLLIAIDTSGSMSRDDLVEIGRQLRLVQHLLQITIVECDAVIQRVYRFVGRLSEVAGRGGTDLRPVFAPGFLQEHRPDGVIYFTDGVGPYPWEAPGVRTLWVLTERWDFPCSWGQRTYLR